MSSSESEIDETEHVAALKRLKNKDPEFYQFLKENDEKLLEYRDSDEEGLDLEDEAVEEEQAAPRKQSKLSETLIENLKLRVQNSPDIPTCKRLMSLMKSVVSQASGSEVQGQAMISSGLFNDAIKLCLVELVPALNHVLKLGANTEPHLINPSKSKLWRKISTTVKSYLIDTLKILNFISEPSSLKLLLKHIVSLVPFYLQFVKLSRLLLKKMTEFWSMQEEAVRVVALLIIIRVLTRLESDYHPQVLKQMYFAYVRNSKFVSPSSYPLIQFMKRSLAEVYSLDSEIAYEHCFIYLRQLCIHLRNAIITKKKESHQTVYNWQYIQCLMFWAQLLCTLHGNAAIKTLIYPLVQTVIGTINLIPTLKYVPLRFHLVRILIQVSKETGVYIPIAPLIFGALDLSDFNKKATFSKKPVNFSCALKVSKSQLQESAFKDGIVNEVCDLLNDYFAVYTHTIAFPELALPAVFCLKSFLKKNRIAKYGQQLKAVLEKLQQNSESISQERKKVTFKITDYEEIKRWEEKMKQRSSSKNNSTLKRCQENESLTPKKKKKLSH